MTTPTVADALASYIEARALRGSFDLASIHGGAEAEVRARFSEAGVEPTADVVAYFSVLFRLDESDGLLFGDRRALDLDGALTEHATLRALASELAQDLGGDDPNEVFPEWHLPVSPGKPTTVVDLRTGRVLERWWDEEEARPVADDLASWLTEQTASLSEKPIPQVEATRRAPVISKTYDFLPGQTWIWLEAWAPVYVRQLTSTSRAVVRHRPVGAVHRNLGLEAVQAELVAQMLTEEIGFERDQVELRAEAGDRMDLHRVEVTVDHG